MGTRPEAHCGFGDMSSASLVETIKNGGGQLSDGPAKAGDIPRPGCLAKLISEFSLARVKYLFRSRIPACTQLY